MSEEEDKVDRLAGMLSRLSRLESRIDAQDPTEEAPPIQGFDEPLWAMRYTPESSSDSPFFLVTGIGTTTATIGEGYGCFAGAWTELSDGTGTITGFNGADGAWYACAKIDFSSGAWSLVKSAVVDTLPTNTDAIQYYILAKVTTANNVINAIEQRWFGGWCIYENRV